MQALTALETSFMTHIAAQGLSFGTIEEYNFRKELYAQADKEIEEFNN